jgi:hypothetical protein
MTTPLVTFYRGDGRDAAGRRIEEILAWDDDQLEDTHDYIQWLFPLPEPSAFNWSAPILEASDIAAFSREPALLQRLREALVRMLSFYGFEVDGDQIRPTAHFPERRRHWLRAGDHNLLRITRILKSLTLLGLADEADAFFTALVNLEEAAVIPETTWRFWRDALASASSKTGTVRIG